MCTLGVCHCEYLLDYNNVLKQKWPPNQAGDGDRETGYT